MKKYRSHFGSRFPVVMSSYITNNSEHVKYMIVENIILDWSKYITTRILPDKKKSKKNKQKAILHFLHIITKKGYLNSKIWYDSKIKNTPEILSLDLTDPFHYGMVNEFHDEDWEEHVYRTNPYTVDDMYDIAVNKICDFYEEEDSPEKWVQLQIEEELTKIYKEGHVAYVFDIQDEEADAAHMLWKDHERDNCYG